MKKCILFFCLFPLALAYADRTVTWTIGNVNSALDGGASTGPLTFTWTFNQNIEHGVYADGTPWVVWAPGLKLLDVMPKPKQMNIPIVKGKGMLQNGWVDGTCINPSYKEMPLDERMKLVHAPSWNNGAKLWTGEPVALQVGDNIMTARSRKDARKRNRRMVFTAVGVCNIVGTKQVGYYRPPLRMPRELRAGLKMPKEVDVSTLPSIAIPNPMDWNGNPVALDLQHGPNGVDADRLLNGPMTHVGMDSYLSYETASAMLNHNIGGYDASGYHRDVSDRLAACLHTAFDSNATREKRQRSLNKFIQAGLDFYYSFSQGHMIWNGGGGHGNGTGPCIHITGALLGDANMTNAIKLQRFDASVVGMPQQIIDMRSDRMGAFTRSEVCHFVHPAPWKSGQFQPIQAPTSEATIENSVAKIDFADPNHVLNIKDVPYTALSKHNEFTAVHIDPAFSWPFVERAAGVEGARSYAYLGAIVMRFNGDKKIRHIVDYRQNSGKPWKQGSFKRDNGKGGVLLISPALDEQEMQSISSSGLLVTGICSRKDAESGLASMWFSWPVLSKQQVLDTFTPSPYVYYFDNKIGDYFHWLPFYHLLDDPDALGKKLYETDPNYQAIMRHLEMYRSKGRVMWDIFLKQNNVPREPSIQALNHYYLYANQSPSVKYKVYDENDSMWVD